MAFAATQRYQRVSLETGTEEVFVAARALYANAGFRPCPPFADYRESPYNTSMTISLAREPAR